MEEMTEKKSIIERKHRATKEEKVKMFKEIENLHFIRGWTPEDVASAMNLKTSTAQKYIDRIKKSIDERAIEFNVLFKSVEEWTIRVDSQLREVLKRAWDAYNKAANSKDRLQALARVQGVIETHFNIMQSMGIAPKAKVTEKAEEKIIYVSKLKEDPQEVKIEEKGEVLSMEIKQIEKITEASPSESILPKI